MCLIRHKTNLKKHNIRSVDDVHDATEPLVSFSPDVAEKNLKLKKYLYENLYTTSSG